jgi:uncharacterized membrane protein YebE (DUF533 family)
MGLMNTLIKVGIGVAIAKGMQSMRGAGSRGGTTGGAGGGIGGLLGGLLGGRGNTTQTAGRGTPYSQGGDQNGLGNIMDDVLGKGGSTRTPRRNAPKGGLNDLLIGGTGGAIGGLFGGASSPSVLPEPQEETLEAALLLRCMIMAAKADGDLDADEKAKLMEAVGEAEKSEIAFINSELSATVDVAGLVRQIPNGMEEKAYLVSLMAINLDQRAEAEYLHALATALELSEAEVNAIHDKAGAPKIYN